MVSVAEGSFFWVACAMVSLVAVLVSGFDLLGLGREYLVVMREEG